MLYEKNKAGDGTSQKERETPLTKRRSTGARNAGRMLGLIRENIHYNIGLLWLGLVVMLFNYPVNLAFQLSNLKKQLGSGALAAVSYSAESSIDGASIAYVSEKVTGFAENAERLANRVLDGSYTFIAAIIIAAAMLCAWAMFRYLFQKPMTDFYNSQPIRRGKRFLVNYLSGILIMLLCYAVGLLGAVLVCAGMQIGALRVLHILYANAGWLLLFLLCYNVFVIAILLAGNLGTAVGASICFLAAGPAAAALAESLMSVYFSTFAAVSERTKSVLFHASPIYLISQVIQRVSEYRLEQREGQQLLLSLLLASAVLCFIAFLLFLHRPSEAAGQSAAFLWSKRPVRLILSIFIGLYASLLAVGTESFAWSLFFLLTGTVLTHAVLEIIFHMDVRALFCDRIELGVCAAAALLVLCCFRFDWAGYDSWLPAKEAVASVGVDAEYPQFLEERGAVARAKKHYAAVKEAEAEGDASVLRSASYYSSIDELLEERMRLSDSEDIALVIGMAKAALDAGNHADGTVVYDIKTERAEAPDAEMRTVETETVETETVETETPAAETEQTVSFRVTYRMKNGDIRRRRYDVPQKAFTEAMPALYQSEDYKEALYPILSLTPDEVGVFGLAFRDDPSAGAAAAQARENYPVDADRFSGSWYYGYENETFDLERDKELEKKLLLALQNDLRAMQFSDYKDWFRTDQDGMNRLSTELLYYIPQEEIRLETEFGSDLRRYGRRFEDNYPVLDSFTEVKAVLGDYGLLPEGV